MDRKLWVVSTFAVLTVAIVLLCIQPAVSGQNPGTNAEEGGVAGTGTLSGTVKAPKAFTAARVYAKNVDKNVVYMVYTNQGHFRAINLLPGNYEVNVVKNGFKSADAQKITVTPGVNASADFSLNESQVMPIQGKRPGIPKGLPLVSYDTLYPAAEARESIERTCMHCHGPDFIPSHQWDDSQWNAAINLMSDTTATIPGRILPGTFTTKQRQDLVDYLVKNFGPDSTPRGLEVPDMPVDEQILSKAMYVEYHLPPLPNNKRRGLHDSHFDNNGNVWYTDRSGLYIGRVDPRTGSFKDYPIPDPIALPHGITMDHDGQHMWWAGNTVLTKLDTATGEMTLHPVGVQDTAHQSHGHTPVMDAKDNVWFTASYTDEIGQFDQHTDKLTMFKVPTAYSFPYALVMDAGGKLWMAEWSRCKAVKFDPELKQFTEYSPLTRPCTMRRLSVDHKGIVWYALGNAKIGKLDPNTGKIIEYTLPVKFAYPYDIQPDAQDNMWISDSGQGGALVKFDQGTEKFTYYPSPQMTDMPKLEITREGAIWYTTRAADAKEQAVGVLYPDISKIKTMAAYY